MHSQTSNTIAENLVKDFISHFDIQLEIHKVEAYSGLIDIHIILCLKRKLLLFLS